MMVKVRWGILSTANIARTEVIPAIKRADNAELVGIASRDEKVYRIAKEFDIPKAFVSYEELLKDDDIDAVYIPLPNHLHKEWVEKAAHYGKHVLCEKPVALTVAETIDMINTCAKSNVKLMEAFMYQFHPQHERVRELISEGAIGEVKLFKSSHSFYLVNRVGDIRMDVEMGGGSIYDIGCYSIHAARSILKAEPESIHGIAKKDLSTNVDTSAYIHMVMDNKVPVLIDCSFDMLERNEYEVIGTKGKISVPFAFRPDRNGGVGEIILNSENKTIIEKIPGDIYKLEIEHFTQCILQDTEPLNTSTDSINNMKAIQACYQSITN